MSARRTACLLAASLLLAGLAGGCSTTLGDFTVLSSKNVDLSNFNTEAGEKNRQVVGEDMKSMVVFFPTGEPNMKEACDRALENGDAYALTNARLRQKGWWFIYGEFGFEVAGNPVPRP
jgi:hypothetical protein